MITQCILFPVCENTDSIVKIISKTLVAEIILNRDVYIGMYGANFAQNNTQGVEMRLMMKEHEGRFREVLQKSKKMVI